MPMNYPQWRGNQQVLEVLGVLAVVVILIPAAVVAAKVIYDQAKAKQGKPPPTEA